jgi:hypothetical protein
VKVKSADHAIEAAPSKREARAGHVLEKLKKRARLDERLLAEPAVKEKKKDKAANSIGDDAGAEEGEEVVMSSTLQAAKVCTHCGNAGSWGDRRISAIFFRIQGFLKMFHLSGAAVPAIKPAAPARADFLLLLLLLLRCRRWRQCCRGR